MTKLVFIGRGHDLSTLGPSIVSVAPELQILPFGSPDACDAEVAICWDPPRGALRTLPKLRLVHAIAAGVDNILSDPDYPAVPLCRVVDVAQAQGMTEFVLWGVLHFHRQFDWVQANQRNARWITPTQYAANDRAVGVMGLGELGARVANDLAGLGFRVRGWSRSKKELPGIETFAGPDDLGNFLDGLDILICLLPLTHETKGLLNKDVLRRLPRGSKLIHAGRGEHLVVEDLLEVLSDGHLSGAIVDVFPREPLPADDPVWRVPNLIVTPHMASISSSDTIGRQIAQNVRRLLRGEALLNQVDVERGF